MDSNRKSTEDIQQNQPDDTHKGHRKRMRERYAENGFDGFSPHEVLEMLLYRSITRGNTNPAAHALLDSCGSMESVMKGDAAVPGTGEKTLAMFRKTDKELERLFRNTLANAPRIGRSQIYTAAVCGLRRYPDGVFIMLTGRNGRYRDMAVLDGVSPAEILAELLSVMKPDQLCHIACMTDPESLRSLRRQYGRTILGYILCLTPDWEAVWL